MSCALVSVVIPNWNGLSHLPECFAALSAQTYAPLELILVDNASTDDSVRWMAANVPAATVICRANNDGFAAAVNEGIRAASGEFVYLLNNDTHAEPEAVEALVRALEDRRFDFAASLMVFYDEPQLVNTAGDVFSASRLLMVQRGAREPVERYSKPCWVLGASGGAVMYRRSFFDAVGYYDEDFFVLHEDTDVNLRALIAGQRCLYVPESVVRHKVGSSVGRTPSPRIVRESLRNQYLVLGKDLPYTFLLFVGLIWAWRMFRKYVPVRPDKWYLIPQRWDEFKVEFEVQKEGFRLGLSKRPEVWVRKQRSLWKIMRWLLRGTAPI